MPGDYNANIQQILAALGADPRAVGMVNELTPRDLSDPMAVAETVGGQPSFYQGSKLGAYIYPPGPINQQHPVMAAIAGMEANRRNALERERLRRILAGMGQQGQQPQQPMGAGGGANIAPQSNAINDLLFGLKL